MTEPLPFKIHHRQERLLRLRQKLDELHIKRNKLDRRITGLEQEIEQTTKSLTPEALKRERKFWEEVCRADD